MPNFDYYPKPNPTVDPYIKSIQEKLNYIRISHKTLNKGYDGKAYNWQHLTVDGQYGQITSDAVKAFQTRRGIVPASGILGATTARYIEEAYNKGGVCSPYVKDIQHKLNVVDKANIAEDGLWGQQTISAIRNFRNNYGLSNRPYSANGELDTDTMNKLNDLYYYGTKLGPSTLTISQAPRAKVTVDHFNAWTLPNQAVETFINFTDSIRKMMGDVMQMKNPSPTSLFKFFKKPLESLDPNFNKLRRQMEKFASYTARGVVAEDTIRTSRHNPHTRKGVDFEVHSAQQQVSSANVNRNMAAKTLSAIDKTKAGIVNEIRNYDIANKVKTWFNNTRMHPTKATGAKPKVGGVVGYVWAFKDVLWDLKDLVPVATGGMKFETWFEDFRKDFYAALDGLIIGLISTFIAEALVAAGVGVAAAAGISAPVIAVAIIVFILATIIGMFISWLLDKGNISFSQFILEGCSDMIVKGATVLSF